MKKLKALIIILLISTSVTMAQQLSTITFSEANSNLPTIGTVFNDPVNISGFPATVRYIEVVINYDPAVIQYVAITNLQDPTALANVSFPVSGQIKINYNKGGFSYFAVSTGKLFDIQFSYSGGDSPLTFDPTCKYRTSSIIPITNFVHGAIDGNYIFNTISSGPWATAGGWSLGVVPNAYHNVTVASGGTVTIAASTTGLCNDLTIQSGGQLTVDGTLTNSGDVVIQSNGTSAGSLLHNSTLTATVERYVPGAGYHLVSIPTTQAANPVSGLFMNSYLYRFDAPTQAWIGLGGNTDTPLTVNQGYMIWYTGGSTTYSFTGTLNNGSFTPATPSVATGGFSLVPNPYPSAIDWEAASGWSDANFTPSIWVYSNGNYVTYNKSTNVGSGSQYIATGQSFFVEANAASVSLSMTNDVRVHNSQPFLKNTKSEISNLLNIKVQANDYEDAALVYFNENGSSVYNNQFDTYKLDGLSDAPQLYTVKEDDVHVTLNTLPFNTTETVDVPLNFTLTSNQDVTFDFSGLETFEASYDISLEDLLTGQMVDLREHTTYTFAHSMTDNAARFVLHFYGVTGVHSPSTQDCKIWNYNEQVYISIPALAGENARIELYDLLGSKLNEINCALNTPTVIDAPKSGIVLVKVIVGNKIHTSKLLIP
jgi:hypothetical protein